MLLIICLMIAKSPHPSLNFFFLGVLLPTCFHFWIVIVYIHITSTYNFKTTKFDQIIYKNNFYDGTYAYILYSYFF